MLTIFALRPFQREAIRNSGSYKAVSEDKDCQYLDQRARNPRMHKKTEGGKIMKIEILSSSDRLGEVAGMEAGRQIQAAIARQGAARLLLATGQSQKATLATLRAQPVDWPQVEVFHLDEYVGLDQAHPASFRRYLHEEFTQYVPIRRMVWIAPNDGPIEAVLDQLTAEVSSAPMDVALIGIGENGHLAFNDPPADFETRTSYHVVQLDARCRRQQVREGWFPDLESVPTTAISMTVPEILNSRTIVVSVPDQVKAEAVRRTLEASRGDPWVPATALHQHPQVTLYLDRESSSELNQELRSRYGLAGR